MVSIIRLLLILVFVIALIGAMLTLPKNSLAVVYSGGGGGGAGSGVSGNGGGGAPVYKVNNVVGAGNTAPQFRPNLGYDYSSAADKNARYSLAYLNRYCVLPSIKNPCSEDIMRVATRDLFNAVAWYNPANKDFLNKNNYGMPAQGNVYNLNYNSKAEVAKSGSALTANPGNKFHGISPYDTKTDIGRGKIVALNLRVWRLDSSCSKTNDCRSPVIDKTISNNKNTWWQGGYQKDGPFWNSSEHKFIFNASSGPHGIDGRKKAWKVCKVQLSDGTCKDDKYDRPLSTNTGETITWKWNLKGGGLSYDYQIDAPPQTVYLIQVVGLDSRETVIRQAVSLYVSKLKAATVIDNPCDGNKCVGSPMPMSATLSSIQTMTQGQTRAIDVHAHYPQTQTPYSSAIPRSTALYFSRGFADPNTNNPILNDHVYSASPFAAAVTATGTNSKTAAVGAQFSIEGAGTDMTKLAQRSASNFDGDWVSTINEKVTSSNPQPQTSEAPAIAENGKYLPQDLQEKYFEKVSGNMTYETRYVSLNNIKSSTPVYQATREMTSDWEANKNNFVIPAGATSAIVPLGAYHYQAEDGKAQFKLEAAPVIAQNLVGIGLISKDDFPNVGSADFYVWNGAKGQTELNICRTPDYVYNVDYWQHKRNFYQLTFDYFYVNTTSTHDAGDPVAAYQDVPYTTAAPANWTAGKYSRKASYKLVATSPIDRVPDDFKTDFGEETGYGRTIKDKGEGWQKWKFTRLSDSIKINSIPDYKYKKPGYDFNGMLGKLDAPTGSNLLRNNIISDENKKELNPNYYGTQENVPTKQNQENPKYSVAYDTAKINGTVADYWNKRDCIGTDKSNVSLGTDQTSLPQGEYYVLWFYMASNNATAPQTPQYWKPTVMNWQPSNADFALTSEFKNAAIEPSYLAVFSSRVTG